MSERPARHSRPRRELASRRGRAASGATLGLLVMALLGAVLLAVGSPARVAAQAQAQAQGGYSHLGINIAEPVPGVDGVMVMYVVPGSGAEAAGLQLGDIVTIVEGTKVTGTRDIVCRVQARPPGATIELTALRGTETLTFRPKLGAWPDELPPPRLRDCEAMH